jgi:biopolymer transport protein ExbD
MIDIQRQTRKTKSIPLISLIDVVFQMLIYFMLTTSFTRSESLELLMPTAAAPTPVKTELPKDAATLHIYIANSGETFLEKKSLNEQDMALALRDLMTANPERGVLVLSANQVPVSVLVRVMDRIYTAGGKNIAVADWVEAESAPAAITGLPHG